MRFLVFLFFSVLCSCLCMYKICSYKAQSLPQKDLFYLKEKADPDGLKRLIQTHSHMSTSRCGNICVMPPKCSRKERRRGFSNHSSVDAAVSGRRCVFLCESKNTLFGLSKVDAIRNHWLRLVYNRAAQPKCWNLCNAFYGQQFCEPRYKVFEYKACCAQRLFKKKKRVNSDFAMTIWRF